jgi:putative Mg2+ transporter-C (MgtC) family protein
MEFFKFQPNIFFNNYLIPCVLACILGGIIGYQREKSDRPAGLRTNTLVCLGATVFTLVSYLGFANGADPTRIAAGIVTGIGFIGAGVIFRQGLFLTGITTAATIWLVAAIGISIGVRLYYLAFITTVLGFLILSLLKYLEDKLSKRSIYRIKITANENLQNHSELNNYFEKFSKNIVYEKAQAQKTGDKGGNIFILNIKLESKDSEFSIKTIDIIKKIKGINSVEIL